MSLIPINYYAFEPKTQVFSVDKLVFTYGIETKRPNKTFPNMMDRHWTAPVEVVQKHCRPRRYVMTIAVNEYNEVYHRSLKDKTSEEILEDFFKKGEELDKFPPLTAEAQQQKCARPEIRGSTVFTQTNFFTHQVFDSDFGTIRVYDYKILKSLQK